MRCRSDKELPPLKRCHKCMVVKPSSEFRKKARAGDGLSYHCKDCVRHYEFERVRRTGQVYDSTPRKPLKAVPFLVKPGALERYYLKREEMGKLKLLSKGDEI